MREPPTRTGRVEAGARVIVLLTDPPRIVRLPADGTVVLGRSPTHADLLVDHPSVSRRHARIQLQPARVTVTDLESKNGTSLGGTRLVPGAETELPVGLVLEVGDVPLVLQPRREGLDETLLRTAVTAAPPTACVGSAMRRVHELVRRVAADDVPVLLLGETGVGKELLAQMLHESSSRAGRPMLRLNCAAIGESLFEGELFGHEKGAFTGATASKPGLLEAAAGGTVFLDEVGELPLGLQSKLLRVLEQRAVRRVGGRFDVPIDVRFVSATNRDLEVESARGTFRSDLYFRLSGFTIHVPPLRERLDELPALAASILAAAAAERRMPTPELSPAALEVLLGHPWPGNVRELKNVLVQALIMSAGAPIAPKDLPVDELRARAQRFRDGTSPVDRGPGDAERPTGRDAARRERIEAALAASAGNQTEAARALGISRRTLINWIDELGIARPRKRR